MVSSVSENTPKAHYVLVDSESAGQRLDNFLITHLKGLPRTRIYRIVRKGEVRVNKGRVKPDYRLIEKDSIRIPPVRLGDPEILTAGRPRPNLALLDHILYEDKELMILNKPSGLAVHGGSGISLGVIESIRLLRPEERTLELVHRLDRDTSGCLMIAKRKSALRNLHEQLKMGEIEKCYLALVQGRWEGHNSVDVSLLKSQLRSGERMVEVNEGGKSALTEFRALGLYKDTTLVEARLITGRTHQIRVHATHMEHPIAGDEKYGDAAFNKMMKAQGLGRLFLHARQITLRLPETGKRFSIVAPLDNHLTGVLQKVGGDIDYGR